MRKVAKKVCKLSLFSQLSAPIKSGVRWLSNSERLKARENGGNTPLVVVVVVVDDVVVVVTSTHR